MAKPQSLPEGSIWILKVNLQVYLDTSIQFWRGVRDGVIAEPQEGSKILAHAYIDAFQSMRKTFLGEVLE